MDISVFTAILHDKHFPDYRRLQYKYGGDFGDFLQTLAALFYQELPLKDASGTPLVWFESDPAVNLSAVKLLLRPQGERYGIKAAEDEIIATSAIERIDFARESVRRILKGMAPADEQENRILGIKKGMELIADPGNAITEENLHRLYMTAIGDFLTGEDRLPENRYYRDDAVFVEGDGVEHVGAAHEALPGLMRDLVGFANAEDGMNDFLKASVLHFYLAWLHPYFDGNGRMARLLHLWFLLQRGCASALFLPFSSRIEATRKAYYDAFTAVEQNRDYSGRLDVTPFLRYMTEQVYNRMASEGPAPELLTVYDDALKSGAVTEKEALLWRFVLSRYGREPFSTKQLEKDFGNAAYATIRGFVLKFERLGLLVSTRYGARIKYQLARQQERKHAEYYHPLRGQAQGRVF